MATEVLPGNIPGHGSDEPARVFLFLLKLPQGCGEQWHPSKSSETGADIPAHWVAPSSLCLPAFYNSLLPPRPRYTVFFLMWASRLLLCVRVFLAGGCKERGQSAGAEIQGSKR